MKRSELRRRTELKRGRAPKRGGWLRRRPRPLGQDPRRLAFKEVRHGICRVCGTPGLVRRHHILLEQIVRREGGDEWALENGLWVGVEGVTCQCHPNHHSAARRISLSVVPDDAIAFAAQLLGRGGAAEYFIRNYSPRRAERQAA